MNVSRTQTGRGAIISFDRRSIDVTGKKVKKVKKGKKKSSQELTKGVSDVAKLLAEDPIDGNIKRMWVIKGKKIFIKPDKKSLDSTFAEE